MAPIELLEQARRPDVGHGLQQRHELLAPNFGERVKTRAVGPRALLARQHRIGLDAPSRALAEAGAGGADGLGVPVSS